MNICNVATTPGQIMSGTVGAPLVHSGVGFGGYTTHTYATGAAIPHPNHTYTGYTNYSYNAVNLDVSQQIYFHINGEMIQNGKEFSDARTLYSTTLNIDSKNWFHFSVWKKIFGETITDFGVVHTGKGAYLHFAKQESRDQFENWYNSYNEIFFKNRDIHKMAVPEPIGGTINGIFVPTEMDMFKEWVWIVCNCNHPVVYLKNGWIFENDAEAVHFKMRPE